MSARNKLLISILILTTIALITMGIFNFLKKSKDLPKSSVGPYKDTATNLIYNLLFCDSIDLYKTHNQTPTNYPWNILFSDTSTLTDLEKIITDSNLESRVKVLAYNKQLLKGHKPSKKELLAVIVEVGLDDGLDVLASFSDGTARYINQSGKMIIWETTNETSNELTKDLFLKGQNVVNQIGPWDKPRRPYPTKGNVRITFLVSDGLYFGEGPIDVLFKDPMSGSALTSATYLMKYLTETSLETEKK